MFYELASQAYFHYHALLNLFHCQNSYSNSVQKVLHKHGNKPRRAVSMLSPCIRATCALTSLLLPRSCCLAPPSPSSQVISIIDDTSLLVRDPLPRARSPDSNVNGSSSTVSGSDVRVGRGGRASRNSRKSAELVAAELAIDQGERELQVTE